MFVFDSKFEKLIGLQITSTKKNIKYYEILSKNEYSVMKNYLNPYPKRILELGCGLGRMSIFLNKMNIIEDTKYYLADSSIITNSENLYGWNPETWYNDLKLTKEFCDLNGLKNFEIIDLTKDCIKKLERVDFIFSVMAVGFHYPIEQYLFDLRKILDNQGTMIFGVRKGKYENSSLLEEFEYYEFCSIPNENKEEFLILRNFRKN